MTEVNDYDGFARDYARNAETNPYNALYERPAILALAGEVAGLRVLDAGCGPGVQAAQLAARGATVTGVDLSADLLAIARTRSDATFLQHDLTERMPFADAEFDVATAIEVLEHVPDPAHTVAEMARVAERWLLVSVPREPLWRTVNMARGAYLKDLGNTPGHVNHWSKRSFVSLLGRHGDVVEARSPFPWTMLLVRL
jgi:SAM-dependent methyltransferase